jgi:hypothetical protein
VKTGRSRAETIEEARFLLSCGESPAQVAAALGLALDSLTKAASVLGARDVVDAITDYRLAAFEVLGRAA